MQKSPRHSSTRQIIPSNLQLQSKFVRTGANTVCMVIVEASAWECSDTSPSMEREPVQKITFGKFSIKEEVGVKAEFFNCVKCLQSDMM